MEANESKNIPVDEWMRMFLYAQTDFTVVIIKSTDVFMTLNEYMKRENMLM